MSNPFKDTLGRHITGGLFIELTTDVETAIYTLADVARTVKDVEYIALKSAFIANGDPNGYYFATQYFDNYRHYKRLMSNKRIRLVIEEWIEELELKLQADALNALISHSRGEKGQGSAKWLAEKGWQKKTGAGRPSKAAIKAALEREVKLSDMVDDDYERTLGASKP